MIIDLPETTVSKVSRTLVEVREEGGAVALGRVLTLVIVAEEDAREEAVDAANGASREHPMRVIVVSTRPDAAEARLDAQIRVGGDAGASEVIVLTAHGETATNTESLVTGLLLPDAPVVTWWPGTTPDEPSTSPLGAISQRRITDAATKADPQEWITQLGAHYAPGDTDLSWNRLTRWREQLAAVLDQPPFEPVLSAEVLGAASSPSTALLAAWLRLALDVPVRWSYTDAEEWSSGIKSVRLQRASGDILLERTTQNIAVLVQPDQPTHELSFPRRSLRECIAEELRRLDPDLLYGRVIRDGVSALSQVAKAGTTGGTK